MDRVLTQVCGLNGKEFQVLLTSRFVSLHFKKKSEFIACDTCVDLLAANFTVVINSCLGP